MTVRHLERAWGLHVPKVTIDHALRLLHLNRRGTHDGKADAATRLWHWCKRLSSLRWRWEGCVQGLIHSGEIVDGGRRHRKGNAATHLRHRLESWSHHGRRSANEWHRLCLEAARLEIRSLDHAGTKLVKFAGIGHPHACLLRLHHI